MIDVIRGGYRRVVWVAEILLVLGVTATLLPMLLLYILDLFAGMVSPDVEVALAAAVAVIGLWVALLISDTGLRRKPLIRWATAAALALGIAVLADLTIGIGRAQGLTFAIFPTLAASGVALHQLVRLIRL